MKNRVHNSPNFIYSVGTQVVALKQVQGANGEAVHPAGAVGVVVCSPCDRQHSYRVRFVDGFEAPLHQDNLMLLAEYKQGDINASDKVLSTHGLFHRVIYRCVVGSRAFGLDTEDSDIDRRGICLPPADLHWSLYGVPEQLESEETEEAYWENPKVPNHGPERNPQNSGMPLHAAGRTRNAASPRVARHAGSFPLAVSLPDDRQSGG